MATFKFNEIGVNLGTRMLGAEVQIGHVISNSGFKRVADAFCLLNFN